MCNVREFGARGDGITLDTGSIQNAINTCHNNGGGYVVFDRGTFVSGTIYMKSNVFLRIEIGAKLLASPSIDDYGLDTHYNRYQNEPELDRCFIYAQDCENIGFVGDGEINGNVECFPNKGSIYRPMMIRVLRCTNIKLKDLRLYDTAGWTTAFLDSQKIWATNLDIYNDKRYNGDGLDFDGCSDVFVSNCAITGTDDNLCLQASNKDYPVRNVHITNCRFTGLCAGLRIGLKSVGSISHVTISNCTFINVWREGIKIECTEGGNISDIMISSIAMHNVTRPLFIILNNRLDYLGSSIGVTNVPDFGTMDRIFISDLTATDDEEMRNIHYRFSDDIMGEPKFAGIRIDANEEHKIGAVSIKGLRYKYIGGVKLSDIPEANSYPSVQDMRVFKGKDTDVSENYNPTWSRATFMDIRNVENLIMFDIEFETIYPDERESIFIDDIAYDQID